MCWASGIAGLFGTKEDTAAAPDAVVTRERQARPIEPVAPHSAIAQSGRIKNLI